MDNLRGYLEPVPATQKLNHLREYLQWLILKAMDEEGLRKVLAFVGGTALRVIYKTSRFSEDLDFSLIAKKKIDFERMAQNLNAHLKRLGLNSRIKKLKNQAPLASFFLSFDDLLFPLGLADQVSQTLSIKVEVDLNPPAGWKLERYLFSDPLFFWISHFDLPSLFSTKLHALLFRGFDKGRDFYDLIFFLRRRITPRLVLLNHAVRQTSPKKHYSSLREVWNEIRKKAKTSNFELIRKDVRPFLLDPGEEKFLTREVILNLVDQNSRS